MEFGSYTEAEARENWANMLLDESVPKDDAGPRGHRRCEVLLGHFGEKYVQNEHQKKAEAPLAELKTRPGSNLKNSSADCQQII